jgi:hypothetical protein
MTKLVVLDWADISYEWILTLISYVFVTCIVIDTLFGYRWNYPKYFI